MAGLGGRSRAAAVATAALLVLAACTSTASRPPAGTASVPATVTDVTSAAPSSLVTSRSAPVPAPPAGTALAALAALPVKGRAPMTGYARSEFGDAWTDDNDAPFGHNGCDTRNDILRRDLHQTVLGAGTNGCVALSGRLDDPYTATAISFVRGSATSSRVQIDHVVALADAWQTGAQRATARQRQNLANDPMNLLAVDGPANQQKGAADAASWLPANKSFRCSYVARQVSVKLKYGLSVTSAEGSAIARVLSACRGQLLTAEPGLAGPVTVRATASAGRPPSSAPVVPVPHRPTATPITRTALRCAQPAGRRCTGASRATGPGSTATTTAWHVSSPRTSARTHW